MHKVTSLLRPLTSLLLPLTSLLLPLTSLLRPLTSLLLPGQVELTRRVLQADDTTVEELKALHITVPPGTDEGTVITVPCAGDEGVGIEPADVEFVVDTAPDPAWSREGSTLFYMAKLSLADALCSSVLAIPTLDGRTLSVPITQIVTPGATKTVPGEGMPTDRGKGDLVIKFVIVFPQSLTLAQKAAVKKALA